MTSPVVGIDLGTTNTVVAAVRDGRATALPNDKGEVLLPSVVSFHPSGSVLVGPEAKNRRKIDPNNTIYSVKRLIGRSWDSDEVRVARQRFPFEMREGPGQSALVVARKETYTLPEISAFVLRKAKSVAEAALGTPVERAVITVPANFNDLQRAATKVAGRVAGLEVMRILNEPTAAALAYGYGKMSSERIAVYDFGGGTLDITLLDLSDNVFEVLATAGNTFLGGDDIDHAICDRMADTLVATHRVDARADPTLYELLRWAAEDVKKQLTAGTQASVTIPEVAHQSGGRSIDFSFSMGRAELEQLIAPIVAKTFDVCRDALGVARLEPNAFSQVLLVGGTTRIPLVRTEVERFFGTTPITTLNPHEVVALGAAIQANALSGAEKRKSQLPLPPNPAARARLSSHPGARRQSSLPPTVEAPETTPPVDTASYGRPRLPTARGLEPANPTAQPLGARAAPAVAPPAAGQPSGGVPITADLAVAKKRTTQLGLGAPPPAFAADPGRVRTSTDRGLGSPAAPEPQARAERPRPQVRQAPPGATLRSAAEQAAIARGAAASDTEAKIPAPLAFDIDDDAPTQVLSGPGGSPGPSLPVEPEPLRPSTRASAPLEAEDFLDAAELEELPGPAPFDGAPFDGTLERAEVDDDEEETRARIRPPAEPPRSAPVPRTAPLPEPPPRAPARQAATLPLSAKPAAAATPGVPARQTATQPLPATTLPLAMPVTPPVATPPLAPAPAAREATTAPLPAVAPPAVAPPAVALPAVVPPAFALPAAAHAVAPTAPQMWGAPPSPLPEPFELPTPGIPDEEPAAPAHVAGPLIRSEPPLLIDVTPLTLAVETVGGYCDTVISRNSPIPCENSRQFATVRDNQDSVRVRVSQGEAPVFAQNTLLGEVLLSGLRAAPRGGVKIEVAFALDPSGMLNVNATDIDTGRSVSTRIRLVGLSDPSEIDSMRARHAALQLR